MKMSDIALRVDELRQELSQLEFEVTATIAVAASYKNKKAAYEVYTKSAIRMAEIWQEKQKEFIELTAKY